MQRPAHQASLPDTCLQTLDFPLQRLRSLERLESLDIAYVDVGTYSMRLHTVRLTELLYLPALRALCLVVPGLHDDTDAAAFLGPLFVRQLREGCLQDLDITLLSESEGQPHRPPQEQSRHWGSCLGEQASVT